MLSRASDVRADVDPSLVAEHPLVLAHPTRKHRRALYLSSGTAELVRSNGQRCDEAEAEQLAARMLRCVHSTMQLLLHYFDWSDRGLTCTLFCRLKLLVISCLLLFDAAEPGAGFS